jgi:hypothetical protein
MELPFVLNAPSASSLTPRPLLPLERLVPLASNRGRPVTIAAVNITPALTASASAPSVIALPRFERAAQVDWMDPSSGFPSRLILLTILALFLLTALGFPQASTSLFTV